MAAARDIRAGAGQSRTMIPVVSELAGITAVSGAIIRAT